MFGFRKKVKDIFIHDEDDVIDVEADEVNDDDYDEDEVKNGGGPPRMKNWGKVVAAYKRIFNRDVYPSFFEHLNAKPHKASDFYEYDELNESSREAACEEVVKLMKDQYEMNVDPEEVILNSNMLFNHDGHIMTSREE